MHYYQFNIADYRKDTQHLTPIEHYIYRELLDWMYLDECPLPPDVNKILRRLRLPNDRLTDVEQVLNDFFIKREDGYVQERVLFEVNEYKRKVKSASKAGKASGKARRSKASERSLNGRSIPLNQPITNNHKPITKGVRKKPAFSKPSIEEIKEYINEKNYSVNPVKFFNYYESNGWKVGKNPMKCWKSAISNWQSRDGEQSKSSYAEGLL